MVKYLLFLLAIACENGFPVSPDLHASGDGSVGLDMLQPDADMAPRLRNRIYQVAGASFILGAGPVGGTFNYYNAPLYDTELDVICGPTSYGSILICAPPAISGVYYTDSGCTSPIGLISNFNTPKYVSIRANGFFTFAVGPPTAPLTTVYTLSPTCMPQSGTFTSMYVLTSVSPSTFAQMTLSP